MSRAKSVKRRRTLRTRGAREVAGARKLVLDRLERRLVLDSSVSWNGSALSIFDAAQDNAGDSVVVTASAVNGTYYVEVDDNGVSIFNGSGSNPLAPALAVQSISVTGSAFTDNIDLRGVTAANKYNSPFLPATSSSRGFPGVTR